MAEEFSWLKEDEVLVLMGHGTVSYTHLQGKNLIMTVGAASGLNVILKTVLNPGDEVIVFAPYFLEYGAYAVSYTHLDVYKRQALYMSQFG